MAALLTEDGRVGRPEERGVRPGRQEERIEHVPYSLAFLLSMFAFIDAPFKMPAPHSGYDGASSRPQPITSIARPPHALARFPGSRQLSLQPCRHHHLLLSHRRTAMSASHGSLSPPRALPPRHPPILRSLPSPFSATTTLPPAPPAHQGGSWRDRLLKEAREGRHAQERGRARLLRQMTRPNPLPPPHGVLPTRPPCRLPR